MLEILLKDLAAATGWKRAITKTQRKELEKNALKQLNILLNSPKLEDLLYDGVILGQLKYGNGDFSLVVRKDGTVETVRKTYAENTKVTLTSTEKHVIEPEKYQDELATFNIMPDDIQFLISLF
jgi:hypothetical protein